MRTNHGLAAGLILATGLVAGAGPVVLPAGPATVPFRLDHNRLIIDAEIQQTDGAWRPARLWVDTGNPEFIVNPASAAALGFVPAPPSPGVGPDAPVALVPPSGLRVGGVAIDVRGVAPAARSAARIWSALPADANLPATVLRRYRVIVDYPNRTLALVPPTGSAPRGIRVAGAVHPSSGIMQIDGRIGGVAVSLALDLGASYSFVSQSWLDRLAADHPDWRRITGAAGAANIWGLWPGEADWPVVRVPAIETGGVTLSGVGIAGLPDFFGGASLGAWYSKKTARPVEGFLGPNALQAFRVEIDYAGEAVYLERAGGAEPSPDMDLVGLTLGPADGGRWRVLGVVRQDGRAVLDGVQPGDILLEVDAAPVTGASMGRAVDALRGRTGEVRRLTIERDGRRLTVAAPVRRLLGDAGSAPPRQYLAFLKRFVLASGSLKELASVYGISYPTIRLRLDRLIEKVRVLDRQDLSSPFERVLRLQHAAGKIDHQTLKLLLDAHQAEVTSAAAERLPEGIPR